MPITRAPGVRILVHALWRVAAASPPLTPETRSRLSPYVTRYADTLNTRVLAVGGWDDHLHVLFDLPPSTSPEQVTTELQNTTARFLSDVLSVLGFAWDKDGVYLESVSARDADDMTEYVRLNSARHKDVTLLPEWEFAHVTGEAAAGGSDDEELPDWLRDALSSGKEQ
jgi:putative transposase